MICDEVKIQCIGGKGGGGLVSFRREKYIPRGGPDGGDGGRGGDVILIAKHNLRTLTNLNHIRKFKGENGKNGGDRNKHGKNGEPLYVEVPVGSQIFDEEKKHLLADLTEENDTFTVSKGGRGGYGNIHFVSSRFQAPKVAEIGEDGESINIIIELKLIADVGIIGLPSAGKSTLISRVSNARPKIAAYHFTTLSPNLGVVDIQKFTKEKDASFVIADIPGLIEGASEGKGLGHDFLKHIQRTKILIHLIDSTEPDITKAYKTINAELKKYDKNLPKKPQIVAINKRDLIATEDHDDFIKNLQKKLKLKKLFFISAETSNGVPELMKEVWRVLKEEEKKEKASSESNTIKQPSHKIFRPHLDNPKNFEIQYLKKLNKKKYYKVTGKRIEQLANMTDMSQPQAIIRMGHCLKKFGITQALYKKGATADDIIIIAEKEFPCTQTISWKKVK